MLASIGAVMFAGCSGPPTNNSEQTPRATRSSLTSDGSTEPPNTRTTDDGTPTPADTETPVPRADTRSGSMLHGLFAGDPYAGLERLNAYERWTGTSPAVLVMFVTGLESTAWTKTFVRKWMTQVWNHGHVPLVTWLPQPENRDDTPDDIELQLANGGYDRLVTRWADELATWARADELPYERRFYFRPAHEMNGDWFPWSATDSASTPADYVAMWRHLHSSFSEAGLTSDQIQWMWSPNASGIHDLGTEPYYPGDDYVDWVGIDGFNFGNAESWSKWRTPRERFSGILRTVRRFSGKPVALPEVASSSYRDGMYRPQDKTKWIRQLFEFVREEDIKMLLWFNVDKRDKGDSDWAVFDGARGTDEFTTGGRTYSTYDVYRDAVRQSDVLTAYPDYQRRLTDAEFTGEF